MDSSVIELGGAALFITHKYLLLYILNISMSVVDLFFEYMICSNRTKVNWTPVRTSNFRDGGTGRTKGGSVMYRLEFCQPFKVGSRISSIIIRTIWKDSNISFSSTWKKGYIREEGFSVQWIHRKLYLEAQIGLWQKVNNLYKDYNSSLLIFKGGVEYICSSPITLIV